MIAAVLFAGLAMAGTQSKNPQATVKLPPCARYCEWMDSQEQTGSFYDDLPEYPGQAASDSVTGPVTSLPFGYPDSVGGVIEGIAGPISVTVAPSGLYLYVMGSSADGILVLRSSTLEITGTIPVFDADETGEDTDCPDSAFSPGSVTIRIHPRGGYIYVLDGTGGNVAVYSTEDGRLAVTVRVGDRPSDLAFNPAGDRAYVTCRDSDQIFVLE
jgi:DNA-binding beta-propeller fold protein YncE